MRQIGAEGIGSKRRGSSCRGSESRDWVKVKVFEIGQFVVTGFSELDLGRPEAVHVAEMRGGQPVPARQVQFGLARTRLWEALNQLRDGLPARKGFVPVRCGPSWPPR